MARIKKRCLPEYHRITLVSDSGMEEISLVKGGKRNAYLWVGPVNSLLPSVVDGDVEPAFTFTGEKTLRALAHAILKEIGDDRH